NLLEHEMLVPALLGLDRIPGDALDAGREVVALPVGDLHPSTREPRHFAVAEEEEVARVREDRRDVRGDEVLALAQPDDDRGPAPPRENLVRLGGRERREGVNAAQLPERAPEGGLKPGPRVLRQVSLNQVR